MLKPFCFKKIIKHISGVKNYIKKENKNEEKKIKKKVDLEANANDKPIVYNEFRAIVI